MLRKTQHRRINLLTLEASRPDRFKSDAAARHSQDACWLRMFDVTYKNVSMLSMAAAAQLLARINSALLRMLIKFPNKYLRNYLSTRCGLFVDVNKCFEQPDPMVSAKYAAAVIDMG